MRNIFTAVMGLLGSTSVPMVRVRDTPEPTRSGKKQTRPVRRAVNYLRPNCSAESARFVSHNGTAFVYPQSRRMAKHVG